MTCPCWVFSQFLHFFFIGFPFFDVFLVLPWYLRNVNKGKVVDDDPPLDTIDVDLESFVKFIAET